MKFTLKTRLEVLTGRFIFAAKLINKLIELIDGCRIRKYGSKIIQLIPFTRFVLVAPLVFSLGFLFQTHFASAYVPQSLALSGSESLIWGQWKYIGFIYRGAFQGPPNPNLVLTFEFLEDGSDILKWSYTNEEGFCERKGQYSYDGVHLTDKIVWVNPKNSIECQKDPDMVNGKVQITPLRRVDNQIQLEIPLSDETLIYILAKNDSKLAL